MRTVTDRTDAEAEARQVAAEESGQIGASPTRIADPRLRHEAARAAVWVSIVGLAVLAIWIAQSLLVIFGAMVFAAMIDGGSRLLGRVLPIPRALRITIVLLSALAFFVWLAIFAGSQISQEAAQFPEIVNEQASDLFAFLRSQGFAIRAEDVQGIASQLMSGVGTITSAIGGIFGGLTTVVIILVVGIYVVIEPRLYERGLAWMLPDSKRRDFYSTCSEMAYTMRRLMFGRIVGMVLEGIVTWIALAWYGVPMAALLGILTGLLAFIPNIGAFISGILMVLVGFSGGFEMGVFTIGVYVAIQMFDGYIVIPMIAKKTVDLAPALVLAAQLVMGILFGILGLFLADPLLAMIKVALERRSRKNTGEDPFSPAHA